SLGSCAACAAIGGRHDGRQRPSAPATDEQVLGTNLPPDSMNVSGAQKPPPVHIANSDCCAAGTSALGRQWPQPHAAKVFGSTTSVLPSHGHMSTSGGSFGASQPIEHAPVAAVGSDAVGL